MDKLKFSDISEFEWDAGNEEKNFHKHGVSKMECEQVFFNEPLLLFEDDGHSENERRHYLLGQTSENRELFIVFTIRKKLIRIISARDMNRKERVVYENEKITTI